MARCTAGFWILLAAAALVAQCAAAAAEVPEAPRECTMRLRRNMAWGVATAAYQIEGAWNVSRSPSVWDVFAHQAGNIKGNATGDVACDHYHKFKEDIALMKSLGIKHYRFSISWGRILPGADRKSAVNPDGVAFYNAIIDELLHNGITPAVTMFHWDLPQVLHDRYLGPLSSEFVEDFVNYADVLFASFPHVKEWMTFNEPLITCDASYGVGKFAPAYKGGIPGIYACAHNILLAHGRVKHLSRTKYRRSHHRIGISLNVEWAEPMTSSPEDAAAAQRNLDIQLGVFADPLFFGKYPPLLKEKFGGAVIKDFNKQESKMLRNSLDFVGINFYTAKFVKDNGQPLGYVVSNWGSSGQPIGPQAGSSWLRVVPDGIYKITQYVSKRYGRPEIRITENGVSVPGEGIMAAAESTQDTFRVNYYHDYLAQLCRSKREGARISAYYAWSLMDNFEWLQGYSERFGIVHVDFETQQRTVKDSGRFLSEHFFKHSRRRV